MSRSGYTDDIDDMWAHIRWRGAVNSAIKGKRGQALLRELVAALDAMPERKLIAGELEENGQFCALGCVGKARGLDMSWIEAADRNQVANVFDVAPALAAEIMYLNDDEFGWNAAPETRDSTRWARMRAWAVAQLEK
jgi:hypothetical protein